MTAPVAAIVVGSVCGGLLAIGLIILVWLLYHKRKNKKCSDYEQIIDYQKPRPSIVTRMLVEGQATKPSDLGLKPIPFTLPPSTPPLPRRTDFYGLGRGTESVSPGSGSEPSSPKAMKRPSVEIPGAYALGAIDPSLYKAIDEDDDDEYPEGHIGRIWFAVEYERESEKLRVSLMKAKNLRSRNPGSSSACDPFVRIYLMPDERRYLQSKSKRKSRNPKFEESFVFQVSYKSLQERALKLTVFDVDRFKRHVVIGHAVYHLREHDCDSHEQIVMWRDLEKEVVNTTSNKGELNISLCYNDHLERVTVGVFQGKNIKHVDGATSVDCFVKVCLLHQNKAIKTKKSEVVKRTDSPMFNQSFTFKLPSPDLDMTSISVTAMQYNLGHKDRVIGRVVLGPFMFARGKELEHWNAMITQQRDQVTQWHTLT